MGADIKKLRNRIKSVDSTLHLTKAMGLVASSKIRRATEAMLRGREYETAIRQAIMPLMGSEECKQSPYMKQNPDGKACLVVIAGDRGLAGGYNANIFRALRELPESEIIPIGKRACDRFKGELLYERAGEGGFGYDPIFYYPPFGKSFGEVPVEEKNKISHRAVALRAFAEALSARMNQQ